MLPDPGNVEKNDNGLTDTNLKYMQQFDLIFPKGCALRSEFS